ncbi:MULTISPECIES: carbon storage regulator CsrA [Paenibacillus]|jgi:carbon storage regulator|uniref:Translational regulator CsrA n=2 Tax=Paenibacillus TaxID=44249 RepID=A0ABS4S2J8_PAEXY|nr:MULTISPECIES: carbon storage regulator CsrA [Paenibacillus]KGP80877.1 carbon storage regulator CsrA [Paenibacillus sp. MAEPY2]KGP88022.1 carbon storage regulator CsrA [Paenibacillus sp. MAEPY1]KLU57497.1 carbon storage regulator CsrA [Paenibacillus sp. VT-400]MBP2249353.1 carbon storage regulator [Paenibacillus xylanexedens]NMI03907.1 carbon storage regulator CsrA [Paenibacillus sp. SZ31]
MLVLSRKKGESIIIQDNIEVTVLAVEGDTVRIGISAPKHIDIFRKEVYASIQEANRESAKPDAPSVAAFMELLQGIENKKK